MLINEGIINQLNQTEKIKLLLIENKYNDSQIYNLNIDKINNFVENTSALEVYKKNQTTINVDVINSFKKLLFGKMTDIKNDEETKLKIIKLSTDDNPLVSLRKNMLVATSNINLTTKEITNKIKESQILEEKLKEEQITEIDYIKAIKGDDALTSEDLDIMLDKFLQFIIPLIEKIENHNLTKKDPNVKKDLFSVKTRLITVLLCDLYYNILMLFVYKTRYVDEVFESEDQAIKITILMVWILINLLAVLLIVAILPKKTIVKKVETLNTNDFEVVVAEEKLETKTFNKSNTKFNQVDLKEMCELFHTFLLENGLMLEHKKIRELFSSMSASRLVIINNKAKNNKDFLNVLNKFFDNETYCTTLTGNESSERDIYYQNDRTTNFIKGICYGNDNTSNVNIVSLFDVNTETCNLYLNSIVNFSKNPNERGTIILDKDDYSIEQYLTNRRLSIPKNMWFVLFTKADSSNIISNKVVSDAIMIDIDVSSVDKKENNNPKKVISAVNFLDIINTARDESHLSNEAWEKIDEIEKQLSEKYNFTIENKIVRKLETYASVYKVVSEDEKTTLDSSIANILLPVIFFNQDNIYQSVLDILKDILEDENIVLTKECLSKYK